MFKTLIRRSIPLFLTVLFSAVLRTGQEARAAGASEAQFEPPTPYQLERFIENYVARNMQEAHAPGMVISVVLDGRPVFTRGFGFADLDRATPFTPETALRAGSVSKTVTSAAVLSFAERGILALNEPVSTYLPELSFQDSFGQAGTISQLLTLQGGYPDMLLGTHSPDQEDWQPLQDYLAAHLPPRTMPSGTVYSYSSLDHGLLGAALENVSGMPFDRVMSETLFEPLAMQQSTFAQPLPESIRVALAQGYFFQNGSFNPVPLDFVNLTPGIGLITTGADMSRFMQLVLNEGQLDSVRILQPETTAGLLSRQNAIHPYSRARTYGLSEVNINGRAALYQDGNGIGFANRLVFIPEYGFGLFISTNHRALGTGLMPTPANTFIRDLSAALIETYFPPSAPVYPAGSPLPDAAARAGRYAGHYVLAGTPKTDFFKVGALLDYVNVADNRDGSIRIGSSRYIEVDPLVFRTTEAPYFYAIFREGREGTVKYLAFGGTGSYTRVKWFETFNVQAGLAAAILVVSLATAIIWPFTRHSPAWLWLASLVQVGFLTGLGLALARGDLLQFFKGITPGMQALMVLPWLQAGLVLVSAIRLLQDPASIPYTLPPALASAAFVWFAWYWQLFL